MQRQVYKIAQNGKFYATNTLQKAIYLSGKKMAIFYEVLVSYDIRR